MTKVFLHIPNMRKKPQLLTLLKPFLSLVMISFTPGATSNGDDITCLKTLKASISDPNGYLTSWDFTNTSQGSICQFNGIDCWNANENKVLNIKLSNMGLTGHFPSGLQFCASFTGLDLSNNSFTGSIPENICYMVPFMTSFNLSYNSFTGEIPVNLSACQYLNTLNLQHNSLTGQIPEQLATISRITTFNVADNLLSGPIPSFKSQFPADNYMNNSGLCGSPLNACGESPKKSDIGVIIGVFLGTFIGFCIGFFRGFFLDFSDSATLRYYYYMLRKFVLTLWSWCTRDY